MGKVSIIVGILAAVVVIAVVVVVVVVVVLGGIDTSPITEVSESIAVTVSDSQSLSITDDYYYLYSTTGDTTDTRAYTYALTYYNGDTKSYTFTNDETKRFKTDHFSDMMYTYEDADDTKLTIGNPFDEVDEWTFTYPADVSGVSFTSNDEFIYSVTSGDNTVYHFYYRDSGNMFAKSPFTVTTAVTSDASTNNLTSTPNKYYDYFVSYDRDLTDANTDGTKTYFLWNRSGNAEYEKQEHDEGVTYTRNNDSADVEYWLDAQQLWNPDDTDQYYLTDFFSTEKKWTVTLTAAADMTLGGASIKARTWYVSQYISPQTDDKKNSYLLNSWDDGTTSYTYTAPEGKWLSSLSIPFTAKWAKVTLRDAAVGGTASYQIDKF